MSQELLTTTELKNRTGINEATWRHWFRIGLLPSVKIGKRVLMAEKDFTDLINQNRRPAQRDNSK